MLCINFKPEVSIIITLYSLESMSYLAIHFILPLYSPYSPPPDKRCDLKKRYQDIFRNIAWNPIYSHPPPPDLINAKCILPWFDQREVYSPLIGSMRSVFSPVLWNIAVARVLQFKLNRGPNSVYRIQVEACRL